MKDPSHYEPKEVICETPILHIPKLKKKVGSLHVPTKVQQCKLKFKNNKIISKNICYFEGKHNKAGQILSQSVKIPNRPTKLDIFSFEEMENDFNVLKNKSEIIKKSNEILNVLEGLELKPQSSLPFNEVRDYMNDTDFVEEEVERARNPFFKNLNAERED